ncbi:MAG: D-alanyl-D-alanine carboxypeptidase/D-alanyl-D-alanine-endopeptidase [Dysgonamonadaceae bacterium]|jgi:D-alanyl-D-alanine carboxypeptidase/D-alanyl-D-alanine-endopeptidase (penicillin-binding protein 4)|nr:D-alanyl-D-alanine carboxypeptidase/D-alanyl-D-alanine-endopeptidase [Dysgonamonadaceae bacterium]
MKYLGAIILACFVWLLPAQTKNQAIDRFLHAKGFENASIGLCVLDSSGKIKHEYNRKIALTPASILKIITTATALEVLGENYCFETTLSALGDTLLITGSGDPTLGSEFLNDSNTAFLNDWLFAIQQKMPQVSAIVTDESCFGDEGLSERWIRQDIGNYYAPACYGISLFDNTYRLYLDTRQTDAGGHPLILNTQPEIPQLCFTNRLKINQSGQDNGYIFGEPMRYERLLMGDIPAGKECFTLKGSIPDPGRLLGEILLDSLKQRNYSVHSAETILQKRITSSLDTIFYTHRSPELKKIIRVINERSNNHYAEHLLRAVGKSSSTASEALPAGIDIVKDYWKKRNLDTQSLFMFDGSGLSPSNAVSPGLMCRILHYMQAESPYKETFIASLPQAGKEGTVRNVLKNNRLPGKIVMKSGSIMGVQCFAGYYIRGKQTESFVVMVNRFTCSRRETVAAIEKLLRGIL